MPKLRPKKGVLKRVKITATGKVKFRRTGKGHLNSHMSGKRLRQIRGSRIAKPGDVKRLQRQLHRPLRSA